MDLNDRAFDAPRASGRYLAPSVPPELAGLSLVGAYIGRSQNCGAGDELFEAVKRVLADRAILLGDRVKLAAANNLSC